MRSHMLICYFVFKKLLCMEEEKMQCMKCGQWLPRSKLELMKTGTRRRVCNHCKWLYYVKPARERAILRELALRRSSGSTKA